MRGFALSTLLIAGMAYGQTGHPKLPYETTDSRTPKLDTKGNCLIRGGTVLTITNGIIEGGDVLIRNGKIVQVGKGLTAPAGTTIIDAKGKFVMPGLIDAHSHMASVSSVNEWTETAVPEVRIADILDPEDDSMHHKLAAGMTTALVLHGSSNPIGGESQIIKLRWRKPLDEVLFKGAPRVVKFALGENVKQSNGLSQQTRFPSTRMGVEAVYRRAFTDAQEYMAAMDRARGGRGPAPRKDLRLEALANILKGEIIVHCHAYRQDEMLMLARLSKEFGFKLAAFTHALEAYKIAPELAQAGIGASMFADAWSYKVEVFDAIPYNAAICYFAGVVTSINTDTGSSMTPFNLDAAKSMRFGGVPADEALKMVTINPAKQLFLDQRIGSLEAGKDADIAIFEGHPLSVYSRCAMTLVDGEVFFQRKDAFGLKDSGRGATALTRPSSTSLNIPTGSGTFVISGATIHPISGPAIPNGVLVMQDGKVSAIGSEVEAGPDDIVIDAEGMHVYPGFIDAQSQLARAEIGSVRSTLDTTELGRFQPDLVALHSVNPESEHIPITRLGGITTALTRPLGPMIAGQGSLMNLDGYTYEQMGVESRAALYINFPSSVDALPDFLLADLSDEEREKREAEAKEQRSKLKEYLQMAGRYLRARKDDPARNPVDPRLEALGPYLRADKPVVINATSASSIREAVMLAEELKLKMILSGGKEAWRVASLLSSKNIPVILQPAYVSALSAGGNAPSRPYDPYDAYLCQPAVLHKAGVKFAFGSGDSAGSYELPLRAGLACAYGLPYEAALKALTVNPAKFFGIDKDYGTLQVGKVANVVIYDGDPLEITTQVKGLFINGKSIPLESKWTRLYEKYKARLKT